MTRKNKDIEIIRKVIVVLIISISGWAIFNGVFRLFNLGSIQPIILIIGGIIVAWGTFKLGLR